MNRESHSRRDTVQNWVIVLLSVCAVVLFAQTQLFSLNGAGFLPSLLAPSASTSAAASPTAAALTDIAMPVHVAITGAYGRYGSLTLTTADTEFAQPGTLLREALGSAAQATASSQKDFQAALSDTSLYYDFGVPFPLSVLSALTGSAGNNTERTLSARRLVVSVENDSVALYLTDGEHFSRCATEADPSKLSEVVNHYQLGNAAFAYELKGAQGLAPYSLFLTGGEPTLHTLSAISLPGASDALLSSLGFNPRTTARYPAANAEIIVDNDRTLRVGGDGSIYYHDGGSALQISAADPDSPTAQEAVLGCYQLLLSLPEWGDGGAKLCLRSIQQAGGASTLTFDYMVQGLRVSQSSGKSAATVILTGSTVSSLSMVLRQYRPADDAVALLPLTQMLSIARTHAGAEVEVCYVDDGGRTLRADWLAE